MEPFKIISIVTVLEKICPDWMNQDYAEVSKKVLAYAEANNLHYYGAPHETFSLWKARDEAVALNKNGVIVEDLS